MENRLGQQRAFFLDGDNPGPSGSGAGMAIRSDHLAGCRGCDHYEAGL